MRRQRTPVLHRFLLVVSLLLASLAVAPAHAGEAPFAWPDGRKAAVNLAYDDALGSQLDHALPALDRHGFKGSFYLTLASGVVRERMDEWRAAARSGHELGNHTLFHQCSSAGDGREWVRPEQDLAAVTVAQMQAQVALADTLLFAIDGETVRTFTAPCGDRLASDGDYVAAVAARFQGTKLGQGVVRDMARLDLDAVPVVVPVGLDGAQLIALVEEAGRLGTMVGFTFHGIGGDHLQTSVEAHDALLAWLAEHRDAYWVDTFRKQVQWIREQRP